jgi:hypothetical protein
MLSLSWGKKKSRIRAKKKLSEIEHLISSRPGGTFLTDK